MPRPTYTPYLLAPNPEIQEKLQATIDEYFENSPVSGGVTLDQLTKHVPFPEASLLVTSVVVFVTGLLDTEDLFSRRSEVKPN